MVRIGRTEIIAEKNGFGALPIQRVSMDEAVRLLCKARDGGITYYDSARGYTDSEEKLGKAFGGKWSGLYIATKTPSRTAEGFWRDLHASLTLLKTDVIDVYQFHNPPFCPLPGDGNGLYEAMLEAKKQGKIRFIGITNHRLDVARAAINSGLYDTLQFPFSYLSGEDELGLVSACAQKDIGFIAMKALSGGLIAHSGAAYAYMAQFQNVVPIWGVQRENELDEFLSYIHNPPALTPEIQAIIDRDRQELQGEFCRGCGYCMPCPQGIEINTCARASLLLRRAPLRMLLSPEGEAKMKRVESCVNCGQCKAKCPYGLDTPELLRRNYEDYKIMRGEMTR